MPKLIIGLAGEIASGKSYSTKYLVEKHGAESCRFSTSLRDILKRLYISESRETLSTLSRVLREGFGEEALAEVIFNDAKNATAQLVVIDGVRREQDIKHLRLLPNFKFVYVEATPENRYARLSKRGENADDNTKTWEQFLADHQLETERAIQSLKPLATVVIENNGSVAELNLQLDRLVLGVS